MPRDMVLNTTLKQNVNKVNLLWLKTGRKLNDHGIQLRNNSCKPECVGSFNMDWRILVLYPEPEARDKID